MTVTEASGLPISRSRSAGRMRSGGLRLPDLRCCRRGEAVEVRYVGANEQENQHGDCAVQSALPLARLGRHRRGGKVFGFE
jgi:hypothetical protein